LKLSEEGAKALIQREGSRNTVYRDTKGILTVGVGHTGSDVIAGSHWSDQQVLDAFRRDCAWAEHAVSQVQKPLNQNMFDALVSFVFNIGETAFAKSTMKKFLDMGLYRNAMMEFDRWVIPEEIRRRRMEEKAQFVRPV
jgi:lysozyme